MKDENPFSSSLDLPADVPAAWRRLFGGSVFSVVTPQPGLRQ